MSAWVVSRSHVDVIVRVAIWGPSDGEPVGVRRDFPIQVQDENGRWRKIARDGVMLADHPIGPSEIGEALLSENRESVAHAYREADDREHEPYEYTDPMFAPTCAEAAKAIACLAYQSCEHPGWDESFARRILLRLQDAVLGVLPGVEDAPWAWSSVQVAKRRRTGVAR